MYNYEKQNWNTYDESKSLDENKLNYAIVSAEYLNHMEEGIENAHKAIEAIPVPNDGEKGDPGENGKSAYELAVENGFEGTISEWLESLKGKDGEQGQNGSDGKSAYELAIEKGLFTGTVDEYLEFIKGRDGAPGKNGINGQKGEKGDPGNNGLTPNIDEETNHWFIGNTDTGVKAIIDPLEYTSEENGLEDTPVGHVIAHIGKTAPKHYLICDGSVYNISAYPKLANHFKKNFGDAAYFGGNGTTTFAVPDLRGEFLRGTGTASRNTGSGADIGLHQEPTRILNHESDENHNLKLPYRTGEYLYADKTYSQTGIMWVYPDNKTGANVTYTDGMYSVRPTNTSVLYCIKYEPTYYVQVNDKQEIYSLEERIVGKWINNKPLYQKTFNIKNLSSSVVDNVNKINYEEEINFDYDAIFITDSIVEIVWGREDNKCVIKLPTYFNNNLIFNIYLHLMINKIMIEIIDAQNPFIIENIFITVQYTKTTD